MRIRHILFDLDNTLYPPEAGVMAALDRRIAAYLAREMKVPLRRAEALQAEYCWQFGSCTGEVRRRASTEDLERFLAVIHRIDLRRYLRLDPVLDAVLSRLAPDKWILFPGLYRKTRPGSVLPCPGSAACPRRRVRHGR